MGSVGQVDGEDRTASGIFARDDFTALGNDETADNGKAQAEAAGPCGVTALPPHFIVWVKTIVELQSRYVSAIKASF